MESINIKEKIYKMVKEVNLYKNAIMHNKNHNADYKIKKYVEIVFVNGNIIKLDLVAQADITNCDYLEITDKGKLVKTYFKLNIFK